MRGRDAAAEEAAIARLEQAAIKIKEAQLPGTNDKVFGNKVKHGGSGQAKGALEGTGYLLVLCRGELHLP